MFQSKRHPSRSRTLSMLLTPILGIAVAIACTDSPTQVATDGLAPQFAPGGSKGKPGGKTNDCGFTPLRITFGGAAGDALQSDDGTPYVEGTDGGVHLNGATGRLMLWTSQYDVPTRSVSVSTTEPFNGSTTDRIFTNDHQPVTAGCGFKDVADDGAGSAVLEVELDSDGIVRYGKACNSDSDASPRVTVIRSEDGLSWTVEGTSGVHCRSNGLRGKKKALVEVGDAGHFSMTLLTLP